MRKKNQVWKWSAVGGIILLGLWFVLARVQILPLEADQMRDRVRSDSDFSISSDHDFGNVSLVGDQLDNSANQKELDHSTKIKDQTSLRNLLRKLLKRREGHRPRSAEQSNIADSATMIPGDLPRSPQKMPDPSKKLQHQVLGEFFSKSEPLLRDCYTQFASKDFKGVLPMESDLIFDEELGGVLDNLKLGKTENIALDSESEFVECIRESMLSVKLDYVEGYGMLWLTLKIEFPPPPLGKAMFDHPSP